MDTKEMVALKNGEGNFGKCFLVNNDTVYKEFTDFLYKEESFNGCLDIENETFVFPKKLYIENGVIKGYTMKYIDAPSLASLNYNISINKAIEAFKQVKKDIIKISNMGIIGCDVTSENILFKDKFNIIDTDFYTSGNSVNTALSLNELYFADAMFYYSLQNKELLFNVVKSFTCFNGILDQIAYDNNIDLQITYLSNFKKIICELEGYEIDNLNDIQNVLLRRCL